MHSPFKKMGIFLIIVGFFIIAIGVLLYFSDQLPSFGRLPGDIVVKKENFTFYFPLATSIIL